MVTIPNQKLMGLVLLLGGVVQDLEMHFYVKKDYWPHNTGLFVTDFKGNDPLFVFYFLDAFNFSSYITLAERSHP